MLLEYNLSFLQTHRQLSWRFSPRVPDPSVYCTQIPKRTKNQQDRVYFGEKINVSWKDTS